jgi:hypothetical protein
MRYYNDAAIALNELYEVALDSEGAQEVLRRVADDLVKRAGDWRDAQCPKK